MFPTYFKRGQNVAGLTAINTDTNPTVATGPLSSPPDNVVTHKFSRPVRRLAIGWWYEGVGVAPVTTASIWIWDNRSEKWFLASTGALTNGAMSYFRIPYVCDPPQTQATMMTPQNSLTALIIVSATTPPDGTYHFVAAPDAANF